MEESCFTLDEQKELSNLLEQVMPYNEDQFLLLGEEMQYDLFLEELTGGSVKRAIQNANYKKRRVDKKVSKAIDGSVDAALDGNRKDEIKTIREDILRGRGKPSTLLKRLMKCSVLAVLTPGAGPALALFGFFFSTLRRKNISKQERSKIIYEMEQELTIVEEKIKDSESDGDKKKKYQYMRIKMDLEKNIRQFKVNGKITAGDDKSPVTNVTPR